MRALAATGCCCNTGAEAWKGSAAPGKEFTRPEAESPQFSRALGWVHHQLSASEFALQIPESGNREQAYAGS